jgi:hypothetical protein
MEAFVVFAVVGGGLAFLGATLLWWLTRRDQQQQLLSNASGQ